MVGHAGHEKERCTLVLGFMRVIKAIQRFFFILIFKIISTIKNIRLKNAFRRQVTRFHHFILFLQIQQRAKSIPIQLWIPGQKKTTNTLIQAWGQQYILMNRDNLKQENWETIVGTVNAIHGHSMTRVNCKNQQF